MVIDRRYNRFRLIKRPDDLSGPQAEFMYKLIVKLGGEPEKARWLTFTEVVNAAEAADYKQHLDPAKAVWRCLIRFITGLTSGAEMASLMRMSHDQHVQHGSQHT